MLTKQKQVLSIHNPTNYYIYSYINYNYPIYRDNFKNNKNAIIALFKDIPILDFEFLNDERNCIPFWYNYNLGINNTITDEAIFSFKKRKYASLEFVERKGNTILRIALRVKDGKNLTPKLKVKLNEAINIFWSKYVFPIVQEDALTRIKWYQERGY